MTLATSNNKVSYTSSGTETAYDFDFPALYVDFIKIFIDNVEQVSGFTVTLDPSGTGGTVTLSAPAPNGSTVVIVRDVPLIQDIDYNPYGPFPSETHELGLDIGVAIDQQLQEQVRRCIKFPIDSVSDWIVTAGVGEVLFVESPGQIKGVTQASISGGSFVGDVPPTGASNGSRWYDTSSGRTYIYYVDADSAQWVEDNPQNRTIVAGGGGAVTSVNGTTGDVTVQEVLVSGTNIKTINGESLLGAGNIVVSGGGGGGATNLAYTASPTQGVVTSDTGTDATIPAGSTANASLMLPADKTKLDGIQSGAQVNAVTSVFGRTGAVVAASGDYSAVQVSASASATNYTPSAATVEGHLVGIDNALASSGGGGGSGGIMQWQNTGNLTQTSLSTTSPGTVLDIGGANVGMTINAITGGSFNAATDTITLPAGKYQLTIRCRTSTGASNPTISFRLQTSSGDAISKTFAGNFVQVAGTTPDPTVFITSVIGDYAFSLTGTTVFTVNAIAGSSTIISSLAPSDTVGPTFCLTIIKVA